MRRLFRALALGFVLLVAATTAARPNVRMLIDRLEHGSDFRVRMGAALELGKRKDQTAREPLERALSDENPAVRAAAAAALALLGDARAIPALEKHLQDQSRAVRDQVKSAIAKLRKAESDSDQSASQATSVLVLIGDVSAHKTAGSSKEVKRKLLEHFVRTSRQNLGKLPGVRVLAEGEDPGAEGGAGSVPLVMVTCRLQQAEMRQDGENIVYSAKVEYVVHRMPERAIAALVSGSAKGSAASSVARDEKRLAALRLDVLTAAVASAMRRAPEAIRAAMR
jgi:hypothetical protein